MDLQGRGGTDLRIELGRRRLEAVFLQREGITVGINVVREDIDCHHAVRARQHRVGHGHRVLVERGGRGDRDAHASGGSCALTVDDRVGEGIRTRGVLVRRVVNPGRLHRGAALLRRGVEARQAHGVAVGVDTVEGHRDAGRLPRGRPRADIAGARRLVLVGRGDHLEGDRARRAVARGVDDRVGHVHDARGCPGLETHLVTGHEGVSQRVRRVVGERRLDLQVQARRGTVVRQDRHRADVTDAHLGTVGLEDGRQVGAIGRAGNHHDVRGRLALAVGDRVGEGRGLGQARRRGHAQQVAVDESHLEARNVRGIDRRDGQQATRRVVVVTQGCHQDGSAQREHRRVVLGDRRQSSGLDDLDADDAQRRRDAVGHRVGEGVGARRGGAEVDRATVEVR